MRTACYLVAGLGKTGHSIARYLKRRQRTCIAFDTRSAPEGLADFQAEFPDLDIFLNELPAEIYPQLTAVIVSPGVSLDHPVLRQAMQLGIPLMGDIECFAREVNAPVLAITGTNGKSTVTTLVAQMAEAAGFSVAMAGNIGVPVLDLLDDSNVYDLWVLELSSFQLDVTSSLAPCAATILNITPDHLDRHHTFSAYVDAKQRVYQRAKHIVYNRDDQLTMPNFDTSSGLFMESHLPLLNTYGMDTPQQHSWGLRVEKDVIYLAQGETLLMPVHELRIKGRHNWMNALAACALAECAAVSHSQMKQVLQTFAGLPHRSEWVRTLHNVDWINDSKGTNIGATISAIVGIGGAMSGKIVLIAGGQGKGADFTSLRDPVQAYVRSVILLGEDALHIEHALKGATDLVSVASLHDAVHCAQSLAQPGDVVLLSPACASLDMFRDFHHRGEVFAATVVAL